VNIPIFEGFSTKAKVDAARARYASAKLSKDNLYDQIAVDIRKGCLDLKEAQAIIRSQEDNVGQAKEALRISEVSYANGVAINLDVLDAQVSLAQIQKNLAAGIYDYLMAQAYLDRSMGKPLIKENIYEK
jgi:outer membrane protein TolC